jgi:type II secretory pathway predicted ATPase ExeA
VSFTKARSKLANAVKDGADPATVGDLRRDMRAEKLAETIQKTVATWPPLTPEQRDRLASLLRGGA